jgi:hypothetical protein
METQIKTLRVLVGDDQIGVKDSLQQKAFLRNYEGLNFNNLVLRRKKR